MYNLYSFALQNTMCRVNMIVPLCMKFTLSFFMYNFPFFSTNFTSIILIPELVTFSAIQYIRFLLQIHDTISPLFNVPSCIKILVIAPCPLLNRDSITTPLALVSAIPVSSNNSACNEIASKSSGMPCPVCAETGIN